MSNLAVRLTGFMDPSSSANSRSSNVKTAAHQKVSSTCVCVVSLKMGSTPPIWITIKNMVATYWPNTLWLASTLCDNIRPHGITMRAAKLQKVLIWPQKRPKSNVIKQPNPQKSQGSDVCMEEFTSTGQRATTWMTGLRVVMTILCCSHNQCHQLICLWF